MYLFKFLQAFLQIKRPSKKEPSISVSSLLRMEKVKEHNQVVEDHYIGNELTKLRSQLQKQRLVEKVKPPKVNLDPDMTEIIRSAASSASSVRDFYTAPIDALQHMETSVGLMDVKTIQNIIVPSIRNEDEESMSSYFSEKHLEITVHFEENMEDNSSETSSRTPKEHEIDSAISYLADKVIDQIEAEAKLELVEEKFQQLKLTGTHIREDPDESLKITKLEKEEVPEAKNDGEDDSDECVSSTSETNSLVQKLFIQRFPPDGILLKKYFLKWIHYTTIQKIEKENISSNPSQISKINSFLDKIRHEKSRIAREKPITQGNENRMENVVMTKKYRNKWVYIYILWIQSFIFKLKELALAHKKDKDAKSSAHMILDFASLTSADNWVIHCADDDSSENQSTGSNEDPNCVAGESSHPVVMLR